MMTFLHPTAEDSVWTSLEDGNVKIHLRNYNGDTIVIVLDDEDAVSLTVGLLDCLSSLLKLSKPGTEEQEVAPF
jgi:hypothetical protein